MIKLTDLLTERKNINKESQSLHEGNERRMLRKLDEQYALIKQAIKDGKVGDGDFVINKESFRFPDGTKGQHLNIKVRAIG